MLTEQDMRLIGRFMRDEQGATSIEYGLICSLVFLAIVAAINQFTTNAGTMYNRIETNMK
jgi:pilus assembly protein Flp/PilA